MEDHRVVRRRGSHIFLALGSQMVASLSALRISRHLSHITNHLLNVLLQIANKLGFKKKKFLTTN
jgi:hypothetical protein